jgi:hypothetical protein
MMFKSENRRVGRLENTFEKAVAALKGGRLWQN